MFKGPCDKRAVFKGPVFKGPVIKRPSSTGWRYILFSLDEKHTLPYGSEGLNLANIYALQRLILGYDSYHTFS